VLALVLRAGPVPRLLVVRQSCSSWPSTQAARHHCNSGQRRRQVPTGDDFPRLIGRIRRAGSLQAGAVLSEQGASSIKRRTRRWITNAVCPAHPRPAKRVQRQPPASCAPTRPRGVDQPVPSKPGDDMGPALHIHRVAQAPTSWIFGEDRALCSSIFPSLPPHRRSPSSADQAPSFPSVSPRASWPGSRDERREDKSRHSISQDLKARPESRSTHHTAVACWRGGRQAATCTHKKRCLHEVPEGTQRAPGQPATWLVQRARPS
jgi:hypothetical protein